MKSIYYDIHFLIHLHDFQCFHLQYIYLHWITNIERKHINHSQLQINITVNDIFKMDIAEISIDQDSFETEVKKFLIRELQNELKTDLTHQ